MRFKDFVPRYVKSNATFLGVDITQANFESFDACVDAARAWSPKTTSTSLTSKPSCCPISTSPTNKAPPTPTCATTDQLSTHWYQFLRVWYR